MDINMLEEHSKAVAEAYDKGVISSYGNEVHLAPDLFEKIVKQNSGLKIVEMLVRGCSRKIFHVNGQTYFSLFGNDDQHE
ncbi:hypothetical protein [Cytobacillus sp. IB215665]|uniref:hypothetical protein n=1 Tax=Cytobacillus sp. IB215665 TaxID=3097357 RepID=UPI002A13157E|nr:hypothetical protein [Cytobacillus sp. IB215665]MDX8367827.1 hypothetical protein [Cytobacillus sp. IB215665]